MSTSSPAKTTYPLFRTLWQIIWRTLVLAIIFLVVFIAAYIHSEPKINLADYRKTQAQATYLYAQDKGGKEIPIARLHGEENREWASLNQIPVPLQNAFISLEDKRFYDHHGADWIRTIAALVKYRGSQGGSTISQQLVKNLTARNQSTASRKLQEILLALNLENNYSKDQILEAYLNTIPLGYSCYGVKTAAARYFDKPLSKLTPAECASLASITKAPATYNPIQHPEKNRIRRNGCLASMRKNQMLSEQDYQAAILEPVQTADISVDTHKRYDAFGKVNNYFVDTVIDSVIHDFMTHYHLSKVEATRRIYNGGLRIYTTEDPDIQASLEHVYENRINFPKKKVGDKSIQSACTIMNYDGEIIATVGGAGKKKVNRGLNRATQAVRSPGSAIKPLSVYSPAIEKGIIKSPDTKLRNYALTVNGKKWPQNFNGSFGSPGSYVTTQYALAQSLNTTAARLARKLTTKYCLQFLQTHFHLSTLVTSGHPSDNTLSAMAVGGMTKGVNTQDMCAAYCTFGNNGKYISPHCYTRVTSYNGKHVYLENKSDSEQAISKHTAHMMNKMLQTVVTQGTGKGCGVKGFNTYMKTGTTSDVKDKWACGGTPYYCAVVWLGYDQQATIPSPRNGQNPAAIIFATVMNSIHKNLPHRGF